MQLPLALRHAIELELAACDTAKLRAASARLSECYREPGVAAASASGVSRVGASATSLPSATASVALASPEQRAAYLAVRLPATYAAVVAALGWAREVCSDELGSVLDLGSGPGTAVWSALEVFPSIEAATGVERDARLIEVARRLGANSAYPALREATWLQGDLTSSLPPGQWDLVVCSYALNELRDAQRAEFIRRAWARTGKLLVIVEPGTKAGFANILSARTRLLAEGAMLAAPCPNALGCPMLGTEDWCHFAARVERTADHRRLKDATLGHEDEKFSYVAFSRGAEVLRPSARMVRHPKVFSGYTQITLCREGEIARTTVTRSKKEDWRRLKRIGWGDGW